MKGSFFRRGLTKSDTKLSSWLSHRLSSSPSRRRRSPRFMSLKWARIDLMCESSCSVAVLQSGARCVGVGEGAGVGGRMAVDAMMPSTGLFGVMMGRGAPDLDILLSLRGVRDDDEAAMSLSESMGRK